jgi:hypothetical protein
MKELRSFEKSWTAQPKTRYHIPDVRFYSLRSPQNRSISEAFLMSLPTDRIIQLSSSFAMCSKLLFTCLSPDILFTLQLLVCYDQQCKWHCYWLQCIALSILIYTWCSCLKKCRTDIVSIITQADLLMWTSDYQAENKRWQTNTGELNIPISKSFPVLHLFPILSHFLPYWRLYWTFSCKNFLLHHTFHFTFPLQFWSI